MICRYKANVRNFLEVISAIMRTKERECLVGRKLDEFGKWLNYSHPNSTSSVFITTQYASLPNAFAKTFINSFCQYSCYMQVMKIMTWLPCSKVTFTYMPIH